MVIGIIIGPSLSAKNSSQLNKNFKFHHNDNIMQEVASIWMCHMFLCQLSICQTTVKSAWNIPGVTQCMASLMVAIPVSHEILSLLNLCYLGSHAICQGAPPMIRVIGVNWGKGPFKCYIMQ